MKSGFSSVPEKIPKKANATRRAISHAVHSFISLYSCTLIASSGCICIVNRQLIEMRLCVFMYVPFWTLPPVGRRGWRTCSLAEDEEIPSHLHFEPANHNIQTTIVCVHICTIHIQYSILITLFWSKTSRFTFQSSSARNQLQKLKLHPTIIQI